jgi:hypothetical protein
MRTFPACPATTRLGASELLHRAAGTLQNDKRLHKAQYRSDLQFPSVPGTAGRDYRSPFRAVDDPALAGKNMALDPRFANPAEPTGPDGRFFTEDDGFVSALVGAAPGPTAEAPPLGCLPSRVKPE